MLTVPEAAQKAGRDPETIRRWIRSGKLRARKIGTQHVIEEAARAGNVVIVGRGGAYILRDFPGALHVFLRADTAARVKTVMERYKIASEDEARRRIKLTDENWTAYIRQVYGHDRNLAGHYDLVLDTARLGYETTVRVIRAAL